MKKLKIILYILIIFQNTSCLQQKEDTQILFGADVLFSNPAILEGKKIGVVTNHTALLKNGVHLIDTLLSLRFKVIAIFVPEHGFKGEFEAGKLFSNSTIQQKNIPVYSLYGNIKKPTEDMLEKIDLLVYDIQDVGVRFYTYISTLYYVLQAAAEYNIPVVVLDRPNPLGGIQIEGTLLENDFKSFIGIASIPIRYGMTVGELANMFVNENMINTNNKPDIKIIKMIGWKRNYFWKDLNRSWLSPSPNIPDDATALVYPGTCLLEGTNISEGRGTDHPFLNIGAPFINSKELIKELNIYGIDELDISPVTFLPVGMEEKAIHPKYESETCYGISISVKNFYKLNPVGFGIKLIYALNKLYPQDFKFYTKHFDLLAGTNKLRLWILEGKEPAFIISSWQNDLNNFNTIRNKYLLY